MIKLDSTRYYGYFTTDGCHPSDMIFHVLCIAPVGASIYNYIGSKSVKLSNLLCLDDFVLSVLPDISIDWSEVKKF